ncbi:nuclear transport factor 2 family protein [Flavobacterium sp. JLP]|uniref:nuclear transport factor 2 family protein n=1 Tax=unclassified Flavobacterium TaxID=196869 RepID=UPI00188C2C01|nr:MULTISPECIES: nuclear transport factor 2 family protein [unclassified Flavobacterium]MBF4490979.1 nuclear transport factor 2 family protein [Flavobacterium sp. MR2016-29]MBF4505102.1 nuclear transport factor 2 family protein [Flavobacterium sp. JLP]
MNANENLIAKFYTAFANGDAKTMSECYHPKIHFIDPAFGLLKEDQVSKMWEMLILRSKGNLKLEFSDIKADEFTGSAKWVATYIFTKTNRNVINRISAEFVFQDGLIIKHTDNFDVWKWSKQAFGLTGYLLGWTGFFHKKIQEQALLSLKKFQESR